MVSNINIMQKNGWSFGLISDGKYIRICKTCGGLATRKPINCSELKHMAIHKSRRKSSRKYYASHKDKVKNQIKQYKETHSEQIKILHYKDSIKRKYGLTIEAINDMLSKQNFVCKICKVAFSETPFVDHDHKSGLVRGLLCRVCNINIGWIERMGIKTAINYLNSTL